MNIPSSLSFYICIGCVLLYIFPHQIQYFDPSKPLTWIMPSFEHAGVLHLFFNIYWLYLLGDMVENIFAVHCNVPIFLEIIFYIWLAICSNIAQYYYSGPYFLGLSGIVFGVVGFLYVMSFKIKDSNISNQWKHFAKLFLAWFCICIILHVFNIMKIANIAHLMGAIGGIVFGIVIYLL